MKQQDYESQYPGQGFEMFLSGVKRTDLFDQFYDLTLNDIDQITTEEAMYLCVGSVIMVRSKSLPEEGDHFILITGKPVQKDHGFRPQTITFPAQQNSILLDIFDKPGMNVVLLKLGREATETFHRFNNITVDKGQIYLKTELIIS